jgi:UDP-N-acetylglucosamine/UDP-N-acetylgalactosamine diphosphorylase
MNYLMPLVLELTHRTTSEADDAREIGEKFYRDSKVAVLLVAGGEGTRLGFSGPKGLCPFGDDGRVIYDIHAENARAHRIPLVIMTSDATDGATQTFFGTRHPDLNVLFFKQGNLPCKSLDGATLLRNATEPLTNPNGHGGAYTDGMEQGIFEVLKARGIEYILYIQVDNVLAAMHDPYTVGMTALHQMDVTTKLVRKRDPSERVGHLVRNNQGKHCVVEYTEVTPEQLAQTNDDGELVFNWGQVAAHCFRIDFFIDCWRRGIRLKPHKSQKKLKAWVDGEVREVEGYKAETFIFDLFPHGHVIGIEIVREDEFAPVKNASGPDSLETAQELYAAFIVRQRT